METKLEKLNEFVKQMNQTNSSTDKQLTLKKLNDPFIRDILYYTYNPLITFGITSKNLMTDDQTSNHLPDLFQLLDNLSERTLTGHSALKTIGNYISNFNTEHQELLKNIIDKNLKIRIDVKSINKVYPNLIPEFNVALASKYDPKRVQIYEGWYASRKLDGVRCLTWVSKTGQVKSYSRTGNEYFSLQKVHDDLLKLPYRGVVYDGEIVSMDSEGNESFQGCMKEVTRKDRTMDNPTFILFDILNEDVFFKGEISPKLKERYESLSLLNLHSTNHLKLLKQTLLTSFDQLEELRNEARENKWEGLMIRKNIPYEGKRSNNLLKLKDFFDAEYKVRGVEFGPFRTIGEDGTEVELQVVSNIIIEHKGYEVSVGSGFSLDQRCYFFLHPEELKNATVTIQYFEETVDKNGKISLRFPTLKAIYENKRQC